MSVSCSLHPSMSVLQKGDEASLPQGCTKGVFSEMGFSPQQLWTVPVLAVAQQRLEQGL